MTRKAFMMNVNNPSDKKLIGSVNMSKIGFIIALIIPKTREVAKAAIKFCKWTPGKR